MPAKMTPKQRRDRQIKYNELMTRATNLNRQLLELESLAGVSPKLKGSYFGGNVVRSNWNRDRDGLTIRERRFVQEYPKDLNATRAAIRAGYSISSASNQGTLLLKQKRIVRALKKEYKRITRRNNVEVDNVVKEIARIAFSNMKDFVSWSDAGIKVIPSDQLSREDTACIKEISETVTKQSTTVRIKLYDKPSALVTLCRYLGILDKSPKDADADIQRKAKKIRDFLRTINDSIPSRGS